MKPIVAVLLIALVVGILILSLYGHVMKMKRDANLEEAKQCLRTIAETTFVSKEGGEPIVSEEIWLAPDPWGKEIRSIYLKVSDMTISLALSAGPDSVWETEDDLSAASTTITHKLETVWND